MKRYLLLFLLLLAGLLFAQQNLTINGLNEAQLIYRDAKDSLGFYFKDSFSFQMGYRNFAFGMKFVAELPKYQNDQSQLVHHLNAQNLGVGWKELFVAYEKDAWMLRGGTMYETFGSGLVFRSHEDLEFDHDHRLDGFHFKYDDAFRLKAIYGANASPQNANALDLAYGLDFEYPLWFMKLGIAGVGYRNLTPLNDYSRTDIYSGRLGINLANLNINAEYATRDLDYPASPAFESVSGSALYVTTDYSIGPLMLGTAIKDYDQFHFRQQDVPLANYHGETLSDTQASALDERGWQGWANLGLGNTSLDLNYAEAWNKDKSKRMNDAYAAVQYTVGNLDGEASWSHVEKKGSDLDHLNQEIHYWQREITPALSFDFPAFGTPIGVIAQYKLVDKENLNAEGSAYELKSHYEPRLQLDIALGSHSVSLAAESKWTDFDSILTSRYWAGAELRLALSNESDILIFGGREAGGKVCRNGMCRYVAPFSGLRVELATRF